MLRSSVIPYYVVGWQNFESIYGGVVLEASPRFFKKDGIASNFTITHFIFDLSGCFRGFMSARIFPP